MPYNSTYANETDFLEWYRNRYGKEYTGENFVKPDTMSDDDYEIGKSLYSSYLNSQKRASEYEGSKTDIERAYGSQVEQAGNDKNYATNVANQQADSSLSKLEQYYGTAVNALDKSKRQSQQNASIALDKLKKYLPTQIKAQGLGGLGVSESTMLKAYNNYNSDMGAIESDYQQNKTTLETNYADNKRGIESERDTAINAAEKSYNDSVARLGESKAQSLSELERAYNSANDNANIEAQANAQGVLGKYRQKYEEAQKEAYQDAYTTLGQSTSDSVEELLNYVEQFRDKVSENDFTTLSQYATQIAQNNAKIKSDKEAEYTREQERISLNNARETIKSRLNEMFIDTKNLHDDSTLTEDGYNRIRKYIEDNAQTLGEADYKASLGALEGWSVYKTADRNMNLDTTISTMKNNSNYNSQLSQYAEALSSLEGMKSTMSESDYNAYYNKLTEGTCVDYKTYYVQGLGSGRKNDDIDITIGSTSRNKSIEYDLLCGDEVTNSAAKELLNKLTTGTASVTPSNGTLCVVANKMYIYTSGNGWKNVISDHSDVSKAIADFLKQGKPKTTTNTIRYPSDSEIA